MSRWIMQPEREAWYGLFRNFQSSAFRLEGQQVYSSPVEDGHLAEFLAGRPVVVDMSKRRNMKAPHGTPSRSKITVRIVIEPPTPYTRLELSVYPQLAADGDDIRVIAVGQGERPPELPLYDFWMFDERDVWKMHYYENFRFRGAELLDGPDVLAEHLHVRDLALAMATPLTDYLARTGASRESTTA